MSFDVTRGVLKLMLHLMLTQTRGRIFCQRCRASNPVSEELCARCGTRLLLVVEPSSQRYEEEMLAGGNYDETLLERVSSLENNLAKVTDKMTQAVELLLQQARTTLLDHSLLAALVRLLEETGGVNPARLDKLWQELSQGDAATISAQRQRETVCARVMRLYMGRDHELFVRLVKEGFAQIDEKMTNDGVRTLERAAALAPDNVALNEFLGEHFFGARQSTLARDYLTRALTSEPDNNYLRLLLGLACGDEGDAQGAKEMLTEAVRLGGSSFAAHYALGRLSAAEADWKRALVEFKQALIARDCPEAHYVIALACYQLGRDRTAIRHLEKAVALDNSYAEAFYLQGVVRLRLGERVLAGVAFDAARVLDKKEARYRDAKRRMARSNELAPLSLFNLTGRERRLLVTGGDPRLAAMLQADALGQAASR